MIVLACYVALRVAPAAGRGRRCARCSRPGSTCSPSSPSWAGRWAGTSPSPAATGCSTRGSPGPRMSARRPAPPGSGSASRPRCASSSSSRALGVVSQGLSLDPAQSARLRLSPRRRPARLPAVRRRDVGGRDHLGRRLRLHLRHASCGPCAPAGSATPRR